MRYKHIVILGGGFVGSLAAIIAAPFAKKITIIERYPQGNGNESQCLGTPQSHHVHILVKQGQILLQKLVPGILQELRNRGAKEVDWAKNTSWVSSSGKFPNYESGIKSLVFSRKLLNQIICDRVRAIPHVQYIRGVVREIVFNNFQVEKIHLKNGSIVLAADLYIDARGRTSKANEALEKIVGPIPQKLIKNNIRYFTAVIDHKYDQSALIQQYYCQANANVPLGYYASPIENDRIIFTAVDFHGKLSKPFDCLKNHPLLQGKHITEIKMFSKLYNHHIQYGASKQWINNYIIIGDAVCKLNPVYGHGMTLCIEMLELLLKALRKRGGYCAQQLQQQIDGTVKTPWSFVAIEEARSHDKFGSLTNKITYFYMNFFFKSALHNEKLHKTFLQVLHRIKSPVVLFKPLTIFRILTTLTFRSWPFTSLPKKP